MTLMKKVLLNSVALCLSSSLTACSVHATSIVVALGRQEVIVAADTRRGEYKSSTTLGGSSPTFHDDQCKIADFGRAAVAIAGVVESTWNGIVADAEANWNAVNVARVAYEAHSDDLHAIAADWARSAVEHYGRFYATHGFELLQTGATDPQHPLLIAFFTGWADKTPLLYVEIVYIDQNSGITFTPIKSVEAQLPSRELPYSTNSITDELIAGDSERAKEVAAKWKHDELPRIKKVNQNWRWIEFLIKSTNDYDTSVGKGVDVLRIPLKGKSKWLQSLACKD
jgi:hypothetical protein